MSSENQIHICPPNVRHIFKDLRVKTKQVGNTWHFFKMCTRCTALMETIVGHKTAPNGDVVPTAASYLITSAGSVVMKTTVAPAGTEGVETA